MDFENKKDVIVEELTTMMNKEMVAKNFFKMRAYKKVIDQIKNIEVIKSFDDTKNIKGIGEKIHKKLEEIFKTGKLKAAERARESNLNKYQEFLKINGIGISKAHELVDVHGLQTIDELQRALVKNPELLTVKQKISLEYYNDTLQKIPRKEMEKHGRKLAKLIKDVSKNVSVKVVGSYRRGLDESGDIDVILCNNTNDNGNHDKNGPFTNIIKYLKQKNYLVADLGFGSKKYLGICKLNKQAVARRIDILITSHKEYPYALLYFTGDFNINIELRKAAHELGYSLSEKGMIPLDKNGYHLRPPKVNLKSEKEIFNFLGYRYLLPKQRMINFLKRID